MMSKRFLVLTALAVTAIASGALAESLTMIDPVGADTTSSGRAIVFDGMSAIAVGLSGTGTGLVWDNAGNGSRWLVSGDGAGATLVTGLGLRTTPGGTQLVAHGMTGSGHTFYTSMDSGVTWGPKLRLTNTWDSPFSIGSANTLGVGTVLEADGTNKAYFGFAWNQSNAGSKQLAMVRAEGGTVAPTYLPTLTVVPASSTSNSSSIQGVSGASAAPGIAFGVGFRAPNAYYESSYGTKGVISTLNGTAGEAWAVSNDGLKIFGRSTVTDGRTGLYPWMNTGFRPTYTPPGGTAIAGVPGTAVELPTLPGATGYASNGLVYGASADGKYAVGMNYPGVEKAVLYNTVTGELDDLTAYFAALGQLDGFVRLSRAYSVYDATSAFGGVWITGEGVWSDGTTSYTRGFVLNMVPEPATLALLALGLPLLRRRRH